MYKRLKQRMRKSSKDDDSGENDGFPLPCTDSELREFDKEVFQRSSETVEPVNTKKTRRRKHDRNRSKSATSIPDLAVIRLKLQKLQSPGKPKFLEHLINRVVSRKAGKRIDNGLTQSLSDSQDLAEVQEPLSPDTEKCLEAAETLVEEILLTAKRPASGESSDSGKGSLLESTSDFSPTPKQTSWSTPTSPTFHGIVKQRLRRFQTLQETSDTESTHSLSTDPVPTIQKTFAVEEYETEIANVKKFYCALSQDESFNSSVMERGFVKTLVQRINTNRLVDNDNKENKAESAENDSNFLFEASLKSVSKDEDSGWDEWSKENDVFNDEEEDISKEEENTNESVQSQENTNERVQSQENTNERVQSQENTNERVQSQENTNERVPSQENTNERVQSQENTNERVPSQENTNERVQSQENTNERVPSQECPEDVQTDTQDVTLSSNPRISSASSAKSSRTNSVNSSCANSVSDSEGHVSKALKRFNQERNKVIPNASRLTSTYLNHNSCFKSPHSFRHPKLSDTKSPASRNPDGANTTPSAKSRNCMSCDVESSMNQSNFTDCDKRGCVSQSFDFGFSPLNPEELFDQNWSKLEFKFDDFSDEDLEGSSDKKEEEEEDEQPKDKLHQIAYELLKTERAYVSRLHLLDQIFHFRVVMENKNNNILPAEVVTQMFANIKPIYTFHKDFLLPQLETRMKNWSVEQKIGDVMAKLAPFLKIYTEYVKNFDNAMALLDKWTSQCPKFASLLQEIQKSPECGQLTLQHHMLEPIQRVPRYELLLKDYLKHLAPEAPDRVDGQKALDLVITAASHSNTAMKKIEKFNKLLNIIQRLNGEDIEDLVSPTRELMKEGTITKISARSGERQARYLFLFNDLLLVCSDKIMGSYKVRARLKVDGMDIMPGENHQISNTFCVKCTEKNIEFLDEANNGEGLDWLAMFHQVITDYQQKVKLHRMVSDQSESEDGELTSSISLGKKAPKWDKDEEVTMCHACQEKFTAMKRRHHCRACGRIFCHRCSSKKIKLAYDPSQFNRVCQKCFDTLQGGEKDTEDVPASPCSPKPTADVKQVEADKAAVLCGYLNVMDKGRTWTKRWITVHSDFVLYFYKKNKDPKALQTMPLPGHTVKVHGDSQDRPNVFSLTHKDITVCSFQAESDDQFNQWSLVLEKMVKLELPTEEEKRLSTHSSESNQSSSSGQS